MLAVLLLPLAFIAACDKVPLMAPTGSVITIIPASTTVPLNSQMQIVATVIEHGAASSGSGTGSTTTASTGGTPVQNGTVVTFTTTIGRIEPAEARTHNGQVTVTLFTGADSGTPTITAYSGGASTTNKDIKIGTAAVKTVTINASPATLGSSGGSTAVTATVINDAGGPVSGIPVTFTTDNGTVTPATVNTDASGIATTTLATTKTAKVSATAGTVATATPVTVTVNPTAITSFSASPNATSAGTPVTFTVTPNTAANIQNVRVNFGDGRSTDLGAIGGPATTQNTYCSPGTYTASAIATDANGGSGQLSTSVIIGALPVTLTASPNTPTVGSPVTFTVSGLSTSQVSKFVWTFVEEGATATTTSPQITHPFNSRGLKTIRVDVFGVSGCQIGNAQITLDVV